MGGEVLFIAGFIAASELASEHHKIANIAWRVEAARRKQHAPHAARQTPPKHASSSRAHVHLSVHLILTAGLAMQRSGFATSPMAAGALVLNPMALAGA